MGQDLHVGKTFNLIDKPERVIITAKHLAVSLAPNSRTSKCRPVCHCLSQQGMYLSDQSLTITLQNTIYSRGILKRTRGCLDGHSILTFQQWRHCEKEWFASAKRICPNQVHKMRIWLPFWNNGIPNPYVIVAIAIDISLVLSDSADINTRLQLSDTSSVPPMHGGFLLISGCGIAGNSYFEWWIYFKYLLCCD